MSLMDRDGAADGPRMSCRQQVYPGPAAGEAMGMGDSAAIGGQGEASSSGQVLGYEGAEEENDEEEEEEEEGEKEEKEKESGYKDPSSSRGRHPHDAPPTTSLSLPALAPHEAIHDQVVYPPPPPAGSSSAYSASERAPSHRARAPTPPPTKRERRATKAPSYMPLWRCDTCGDEVSVFLRDEHCRTKAHLRLARRAGAGGGGGGGGSVYDEAPESPAGYVGLLPAYTPLPGYRLRDTFYCPPCASEFPLSSEMLHDEESEMYMCVCCARKVHTAGRAVHVRGDIHQQMARVQLAGDSEVERYETEDLGVGWSAAEGLEAGEEKEEVREAQKSEDIASKGKQRARVEAEGGGRDEGFRVLQSWAATFRRVDPAVQGLRKRKQERSMARAQSWQEGREAKGDGKPVRMCDVCKGPLMAEDPGITNQRACHCRGAAVSGGAAAAETTEATETAGNQAQVLPLLPQTPMRAPQPALEPPGRRTWAPARPPTPTVPYETYFCEPCNKHVGVCIRQIHIASRRHIQITNPPKAPIAPARALDRARHPHPHPQPVPPLTSIPLPPPPPRTAPRPAPPTPTPPEKAYCPECQKWKRASKMAAHRMSRKHKKNAEALANAQMAGRAWAGEVPVSMGTKAQGEMCLPAEVPRELVDDRWVTINGLRFYCQVCERDRSVHGLEAHMGSASHRRNARLREERAGRGAVI